MANKSKIEWTEATWNPTTGCSKVSQGCAHCYAEREWKRLSANPKSVYYGRRFVDVREHPERLGLPVRWEKPRMIFVDSMSDLFHPNINLHYIDRVFAIMAMTPQHTYQILTKRAERMANYLGKDGREIAIKVELMDLCAVNGWGWLEFDWPLPNVWIGVSTEDQKTADERIPELLKAPAAVRFVSCEPLLGSIDIGKAIPCGYYCDEAVGHVDHAFWTPGIHSPINWVIAGGESGPEARPMNPDWVRSLRDQCQKANVPFFFKQWGEWLPYDQDPESPMFGVRPDPMLNEGYSWRMVGKKKAGRLLDGMEYNQYPRGEI